MSAKLRIRFTTNRDIIPDDFTGYYTGIDGQKEYYLDGHRVSQKTYELVILSEKLSKKQSTIGKSPIKPSDSVDNPIVPRITKLQERESTGITSTKIRRVTDTKKLSINNARKPKLILNFDSYDDTEAYENVDIKTSHECQKHGIKRSSNDHFKISLINLGIEPNIISKAIEIKSKLTTGRKKNSKLFLLFFCIYYARYECGLHSPPQEVAQLVGLDNNKINKAFATYLLSQNSYKPPKIEQTPENFLRRFCQKTNLNSDEQKDVRKILERIRRKNKKILKGWFPQNFCLATIFYYCDIRGINIDREKYSKELVKVTWATLKAIVDKISSVDNS